MTISEVLNEPLVTHGIQPKGGLLPHIRELLSYVGLEKIDLNKHPPQFSGGQLQRIAIARALALDPEIIVADEPTSALDPSIQAQIVNVLLGIQRARQISYFVISHDLEVVGHIADRIAVMYLGVIVEEGRTREIMSRPLHPYTQALLSAAPTLAARQSRNWQRIVLSGDPPNPADVPQGCRFHPRCPLSREECRRVVPNLKQVDETGHLVACHFAPSETLQRGVEIGKARLGQGRT